MRFQIEDLVSAGDRIALGWTMTGTHRRNLVGIPPPGTEIELTAIEINRFEDGLLTETWTQSDHPGFMEQVGVLSMND